MLSRLYTAISRCLSQESLACEEKIRRRGFKEMRNRIINMHGGLGLFVFGKWPFNVYDDPIVACNQNGKRKREDDDTKIDQSKFYNFKDHQPDMCCICHVDMISCHKALLVSCPDCKNCIHKTCMHTWLQQQTICPYCRSTSWKDYTY